MDKEELIERLESLNQLVIPNGTKGAIWLSEVLEVIKAYYSDEEKYGLMKLPDEYVIVALSQELERKEEEISDLEAKNWRFQNDLRENKQFKKLEKAHTKLTNKHEDLKLRNSSKQKTIEELHAVIKQLKAKNPC